MNFYGGNHIDEAIRTRQMIYEKYKKIYRMAEELEKETISKLGDSHPVSENLGFVCVHLMNGDYSIEENLYDDLPECNKLEPNTLKQAFDVLNSIWWSGARTRPEIRNACCTGAKMAAKSDGKDRNTVSDIWRRRLGLEKKTEGFIDLVEKWLNGDASGLKQALKSHTHRSLHGLIDKFFREKKFCN